MRFPASNAQDWSDDYIQSSVSIHAGGFFGHDIKTKRKQQGGIARKEQKAKAKDKKESEYKQDQNANSQQTS
jgi:hypothetical protein